MTVSNRSRAAPSLRLSVQFADPRHRTLLPRHRIARWLRAALAVDAEITVRIVDDTEGRALNRAYRGKDYATNVLTFDYAREPTVHADIVLAAPVVEREAKAQDLPIGLHYAHLLIHGALHAQGWDHETDDDGRRMQAHESALMGALGLPDPYARASRRSNRAASSAK